MPIHTNPDEALFRVEYNIPGQSGQVFNLGAAQVGETEAQDVAEAIRDRWESNIMPLLCDTTVLVGVTVIRDDGGEVFSFGEAISGEPGGEAQEPMPPQVSVLIRKNTALAGRQGKGRWYIPGIPRDDVQNAGLFEDTPRGVFNDALVALLDELTGDGVVLCVGHDVASPLIDMTPITSLVAQTKTATQRQRIRD